MRRADGFATRLASFNAAAFALTVASVTYVDARLTSHVAFGARSYPHGYLISLLGGSFIFVTTLLGLAKLSSWKLRATFPTMILALTGALSLPFFRPEFPHGGISIWMFGTSILSLLTCFLHFLPLQTDQLTAEIDTATKIRQAKEMAALWRTVTISILGGYVALLIPWSSFIWNQSTHIVTDPGEAFILSEFGAAGMLGISLYVLFGVIYESFHKARDAAHLVLRFEAQEPLMEKRAVSSEAPAALPTSATVRDQVFISYSRKDKAWLDRLQTMLKPLVRSGAVSVWAATTMQPGARWKEELKKALASAKVAVLLVSDNFLASDFIAQEELTPLLAAAAKEGVRILWVYVSSCLYEETPIADYQAAHDISKALDELPEAAQKRVLRDVARAIQQAVV